MIKTERVKAGKPARVMIAAAILAALLASTFLLRTAVGHYVILPIIARMQSILMLLDTLPTKTILVSVFIICLIPALSVLMAYPASAAPEKKTGGYPADRPDRPADLEKLITQSYRDKHAKKRLALFIRSLAVKNSGLTGAGIALPESLESCLNPDDGYWVPPLSGKEKNTLLNDIDRILDTVEKERSIHG